MAELRWVTTPEQRAGLYTTVITGGRPLLKQRPTALLLNSLRVAGFRPPTWTVSDRDAPQYERDGNDLSVYSHDWAYEYATEHWMNVEPPDPSALGCWGVLMLDPQPHPSP